MKHTNLKKENYENIMLNSLKRTFSYTKYILDTEKFKIIFLTILLTCFLCTFNLMSNVSYSEAIFDYISSSMFVFPLMIILFISSSIFLEHYDKNYSFLIRYSSKENYLKYLLISVSLGNLIIYLSAITIGILFVSLRYFGMISFTQVEYYNISYITYSIFFITKLYIVTNLLALIGICIYKLLGKIVGYIYYLTIAVIYYCFPISSNIISNFTFESLNFKYYLVPIPYVSFLKEIANSIIFICTTILLLTALIVITTNFKKIKIDE